MSRAAGAQRAERGDLQGVRDDQDGERVAFDLVDGERHAVECDGTLGRDEARKLRRHAQRQFRAVEKIIARDQLGDAVDMAADHVAAELVAEPKRSFEVELGAALPGRGGGHAQGLGGGIDGK